MRLPQGTAYRLLLWVVACGLAVVTVLIVHARTLQTGIEELGTQGQQRIAVYLQSIKGELARYDYLPAILALSDDVAAMLRFPADSELREKVNDYLRRVNDNARSSAAYILDLDGRTLAASNSNDPISFVGVNLSYRPYFQNASKGTHGRFYAIGTTSGVPGYFYATPIVRDGATLGVMALKVSLDSLEATWKSGSDVVSIADGNGVVFLSSLPSWQYRTLEPLASTALEQIHDSRQYDGAVLTQVGISKASRSTEHGQIVRIDPSINGGVELRPAITLSREGRFPRQIGSLFSFQIWPRPERPLGMQRSLRHLRADLLFCLPSISPTAGKRWQPRPRPDVRW
jgi:two-component system C4-dicarboxylate transport sensor histidine kinase DctB